MVSRTELIQQQIKSAESQQAAQRKILKGQRFTTQTVETQLKAPLTKTQLKASTRSQLLEIKSVRRRGLEKVAEQRLRTQKQAKLLDSQQKGIEEVKKAIGAQASQIRDFEIAQKASDSFARGRTFAGLGLSKSQNRIFLELVAQRKGFRQRIASLKELGEGEFTAGISKLKEIKLLGKEFGDLSKIKIEELTPSAISRFKRAGLIKTITVDVPGQPLKPVVRKQESKITFPKLLRLATGTASLKEFAKVPLDVISDVGKASEFGTKKVFSKFFPQFRGVDITLKGRKASTILVPQVGTLEVIPGVPKGFKEIDVPETKDRTVTIFEPGRVAEGVNIGLQLGLIGTAPALAIAPGLVAEGIERATDPSLSKGDRLLGVLEAELGLLAGGLAIKSLVRNLKPITVPELIGDPTISGPQIFFAGAGKRVKKQKTVQKKKPGVKAKKNTLKSREDFLDALGTKVTIEGKTIRLETLSKDKGKFVDKADRAKLLLKAAKNKEGTKEAFKLIKEAYGEKFLKEFISQEFNVIRVLKKSKLTPVVIKGTTPAKVTQILEKAGVKVTTRPPSQVTSLTDAAQLKTQQKLSFDPITGQVGAVVQTTEQLSLAKTLQSVSPALALSSKTSQLQQSQQRQKLLQKQLQVSKQASLQDTLQKTAQKSLTRQLTIQSQKSASLQRQVSELKRTQRTVQKLKKRQVTQKKFGPPPVFFKRDALKSLSIVKGKKSTDGFLPLIKTGGKFKALSRPFKTLAQAKAFATFVVDNSTSAQAKIKKVGKVANFSKKVPVGASLLKFRQFRKVNGKQVPLKDFGIIERRGRRIDTLGEIRGLKAAKIVKQRFGGLKIKKFGGKITLKAP